MKGVLTFLCLVPMIALAQGIHFEERLSWQEIQAKAKKEHRYIFVDCYTTWCAPCKRMKQDIFPVKEVGDYFNQKFISVAVQFDKTDHDPSSIQLWYKDAAFLEKKFSINAYPTFLFFTPDGIAVHRIVGGFRNANEFIAKSKEAFDPHKQYYSNLYDFKKHKGDSSYLRNAYRLADSLKDSKNAIAIGNLYLKSIKNPISKDNLAITANITQSESDAGFKILLRNINEADSIIVKSNLRIGFGKIEEKLTSIVFNNTFVILLLKPTAPVKVIHELNSLKKKYPQLSEEIEKWGRDFANDKISSYIRDDLNRSTTNPNWDDYYRSLLKKFPDYDVNRIFLQEKTYYLFKEKQWEECARSAGQLLDKYGNGLSDRQINNIVWDYFFLHCSDESLLMKAVDWGRKSVDLNPENCSNIDTYANLLYKIGKNELAIQYEKKAIELAFQQKLSQKDINEFEETLKKMGSGEKTWATLSQKKNIDFETGENWPIIKDVKISDDGRFVCYAISKESSESSLIIQATDNSWKREFSGELECKFTEDSKLAILGPADNNLFLYFLNTGQVDTIRQIISYKNPSENNCRYIAYQQANNTGKVILSNIQTHKTDTSFSNVTDYTFDDSGKWLAVAAIDSSGGRERNFISIYNTEDGVNKLVFPGAKSTKLAFNKGGSKLAFISFPKDNDPVLTTINCYDLKTDSIRNLVHLQDLSSKSMYIDASYGLLFSNDDHENIFFQIRKISELNKLQQKDTSVQVIIAKSSDAYISNRLPGAYYNKAYWSVINLKSNHLTVLENNDDERFDINNGYGDNYAFVTNSKGREGEYRWRKSAMLTINLYSLLSGKMTTVVEKAAPVAFSFSSNHRYIVWWDKEQQVWLTYNLLSKKIVNLTGRINVAFFSKDSDLPGLPSAYGPGWGGKIAGWSRNDSIVFIYDQFDIWKLDPDGKKAPECLTKGIGRKKNIRFGLIAFNSKRDLEVNDSSTILTAINFDDKKTGNFPLSVLDSIENIQHLLKPMGYCFRTPPNVDYNGVDPIKPIKAKNANVYVLQPSSSGTYPNIVVTSDFRHELPLSTLEPQKDFKWYTADLIKFPIANSLNGEGILFKPESFSMNKKYPVVYYCYEKFSDVFKNAFISPSLDNVLNIPWFVSNDYLVFVPDIRFTKGHPGESAFATVNAAADYLSKIPWVDKSKMGLLGHSFGAFEINYIVTKTNRFAAAVEADGVCDYVSNYGYINSGQAKVEYYEERQGRIGYSLWERPDLYIENSPVLKADKINTPLLIIHNAKDYTVSILQGDQWFSALRRLGKSAWFLNYIDEGHIITQPRNQLDYSIKLSQFFGHFLKNEPMPDWMKPSD